MSETRQDDIDTEPTGDDTPPATDSQPSYDPLAALTVAELRVASRELGADVVTAVVQRTEHYTEALGRVLWLHQRRADRTRNPAELWAAIERLSFTELQQALSALAPDEGAGPTQPQS